MAVLGWEMQGFWAVDQGRSRFRLQVVLAFLKPEALVVELRMGADTDAE